MTEQTAERRHPAGDDTIRVTTLELFFDLVFVFTLTQLTAVLVQGMDWHAVLRIVLMFSVLFWMYDGYVWLTNAVTPTRADRRALLMVGMAGFMVIALAIPETFEGSSAAFGLGYLVVVLAHFWLYRQCGVARTRHTLPRLLGVNLGAAALVLLGALSHGNWQYVPWIAAIGLLVLTPYLAPTGDFDIQPAHFVERHGLVLIVALGESIVAVGIGADRLALDAELVSLVTLGLALSFALWWLYFGMDDQRAEAVLHAADPVKRAVMSLRGYYYAHIPLLIGIVAMAAGVEEGIAHPHEAMGTAPALALGGGAALFLLGQAAFRLVLGLSGAPMRLVAAGAALATVLAGQFLVPVVQMLAVIAILALAGLDDVRTARREAAVAA